MKSKIKIQKFGFLIAFVVLISNFASAQTPFLRKFTVDDGLPSSHIYRVFQDSEGFMWVCTDRGLSRFDGYKFENFSAKNQLPYNDIWDIAEDNYQRLWLSSFAYAITYYDIQKRKFHVIPTENFPQISNKKVFAYSPISKDSFRIESENGYLIDLKQNKVLHKLPNFFQDYPIHKQINITYPVFFTYRALVDNYRFLLKHKFILKKPTDFSKQFFSNVVFLKDSKMFLSNNHLVSFFDGNELKSKNIKELTNQQSNEILRIDLVGNSEMLLIITNNEKFVVDKNLNRVHKFDFISQFNVNSVYQDKEENLWICTSNQGLILLGKEAQNSRIISLLNNHVIMSIDTDKTGCLWFGTDKGDIFTFYEGKLNHIRVVKEAKSAVRSIYITKNDRVLIIYITGELCSIPISFFNFKHGIRPAILNSSSVYAPNKFNGNYTNIPFLLKNFNIKEVIESKKGLYFGCSSDVKEFQISNKAIKVLYFLSYLRGVALAQNKENKIWIGSSNGLFTYDNNAQRTYKSEAQQFPNLNKTINDIVIDENNIIWIATDVGRLIKQENGKYEDVKQLNGIIVKKLYDDKINKKIWAATNKGIFCINNQPKQPHSISKISLTQGLPSLEVHAVSINKNNLYAATNSGLVEINLNNILKSKAANDYQTPLLIKNIAINGQDSTIFNKYDLKYTQNSINIDFVAISFKSEKNIKYEYKLLSSETKDDWHEIADTKLAFNYLSPDTYQFYLRAFDIDGNETVLSKPIIFQINPPYWQTWWFRIALFMLLSSILGVLIVWYRKSTEKDLRTSKKLAELELHALQSQMNPHFVFNALSSIQNFILNKDTQSANEYLTNFSKLIRLFLESSRNRYISISDEKMLLEKYIQLEQARFKGKFLYQLFDENFVESTQEIPSMLLQPFVENAINHGLVYKEGLGHLSITFKNENQYLYCTVDDDGVGRRKAKELRTKAIKAYKSRATEIIEDRLRTLKMVDGTEVDVNIIDKVDENNQPTGTKVVIKILMT